VLRRETRSTKDASARASRLRRIPSLLRFFQALAQAGRVHKPREECRQARIRSVTVSRVVPGVAVTMARSLSTSPIEERTLAGVGTAHDGERETVVKQCVSAKEASSAV